MPKRFLRILFILLITCKASALDTLYTHPLYPPLIYSQADINFYKYTPKYIPRNLYESFKILGVNDSIVIDNFKNRSTQAVIDRGIFYPTARMRKEFCLDGYSNFVRYFHSIGIYYPRAMESYILLCFHQYLNQIKITWSHNQSLALEGEKKWNKVWKKRTRKLFNRNGVRVKESKKKRKTKTENELPDKKFWEEFEEL